MSIGLDYSLSSPSCCIGDSDDIRDCFVFCYAQTKKMLPLADFIKMKYYPEWQSAEERHYKLAKDIFDFIEEFNTGPKEVFIEGYAFGANGKVFNIAEATSVIKQMLYHAGYKIHLIEPNVNKKLATGKGNANKFGMLDAFNAKHQGFELIKCFDGISSITDKKIPAPITDIIDAYWLCQYGNKRI